MPEVWSFLLPFVSLGFLGCVWHTSWIAEPCLTNVLLGKFMPQSYILASPVISPKVCCKMEEVLRSSPCQSLSWTAWEVRPLLGWATINVLSSPHSSCEFPVPFYLLHSFLLWQSGTKSTVFAITHWSKRLKLFGYCRNLLFAHMTLTGLIATTWGFIKCCLHQDGGWEVTLGTVCVWGVCRGGLQVSDNTLISISFAKTSHMVWAICERS